MKLEVKLNKRLAGHLEELSETFVDITRQKIASRLFRKLNNACRLMGCKI